MREQWARRIALLTGQMIVLMAILFAVSQNPLSPADTPAVKESSVAADVIADTALNLQVIEAGFVVYQQQVCARCHSIAGEGNPRNPLDDVGLRHNAQTLRAWIIGADELQTVIPGRAFKIKQAYRELDSDELDALVIAMQSLRSSVQN